MLSILNRFKTSLSFSNCIFRLVLFLCIFTIGIPSHLAATSDFFSDSEIQFYEPNACDPNGSSEDTGSEAVTAEDPVFILGDSITVMSEDDITRFFGSKNVKISKIDAAGSRSLTRKGVGNTSGVEAISANEKAIKRSSSIIIALGTNADDDVNSGKSSIFKANAKKLIKEVKKINPDISIFWTSLFAKESGSGGFTKHISTYNKAIKELASSENFEIIDTSEVGNELASDKIHPSTTGQKIFARALLKPFLGLSAPGATGGSSVLQGHKLPATKGGTGLESSGQHGTFSNHASKGQEYVDYYINMRWDYVKWNWDGTSVSTPKTNSGYQWFRKKPRLVLVTNPKTNKSIITAALDSGPAPWTGVDTSPNNSPKQGWKNPQAGTPASYKGRVSGIPEPAFKALGMTSNDQKMAGNKGPDLLYAWAPDQNATPGPTDLKAGDTSEENDAPVCTCKDPNTGSTSIALPNSIPKYWRDLINNAARKHKNSDPRLVAAVLWAENRGWPDPNKDWGVSSAGAQGPWQFIPSTWASMGYDGDGDGVKDPNNPKDAVHAAFKHHEGSVAGGKPLDIAKEFNGNAQQSFDQIVFKRDGKNLLSFAASYNGSGAPDGVRLKDFPRNENSDYVRMVYWLLATNFQKGWSPESGKLVNAASGGGGGSDSASAGESLDGADCGESTAVEGNPNLEKNKDKFTGLLKLPGGAVGVPEVAYYNQCSDKRWSNKPYPYASGGSSRICDSGCGPTSMAMVATTLGNKIINPEEMAQIAKPYHQSGGTASNAYGAVLPRFGLNVKPLGSGGSAASGIRSTIKDGGLVIASVAANSPFTNNAHIIVIRAISEDGSKFWVADPADGNGSPGSGRDVNRNTKAYSMNDLMHKGWISLGFWGVTKK